MWSFGRTQTPADSGAASGPTVTEQSLSADPFVGLPPEGELSTPETGELIADYQHSGIGWVYVYADGRALVFPRLDLRAASLIRWR